MRRVDVKRLAVAVSLAVLLGAVCAMGGESAHAACPDSAGTPIRRAAPPDNDLPVVVHGFGAGHGVGMSQYGAYGAGELGCSAGRILATYYPGADQVQRPYRKRVHVWMLHGGHRAVVRLRAHANRDATVVWRFHGRTVAVQRERTRWVVRQHGDRTRLIDARGRTRFDRRTTWRTSLRGWHTNRVVELRTFHRGDLVTYRPLKYDAMQFVVSKRMLRVRQSFFSNRAGLGIEKYLRGLAEVPAFWPAATLQAQAIAGRTYAINVGRALEPTTADQYYGGYDRWRDPRSSPWRHAVDATVGRIVVDRSGAPIEALYSASMGGFTENPRYVWDGDGRPYLRAVNDARWTRAAGDPYLRWARAFSYGRLATMFGFERVTHASVGARATRERLRGVRIVGVIDGRTVTRRVTGWTFQQALGLSSPGVLIRTRR